MKNCEEMVGSLLRRRAEYEENRRKQRKTMLRLSGAVCSLALVVFIGAGVNGGWWISSQPELPTVTPTQSTGEPTEVQPTVRPTLAPTQPPVTEPPVTEPVEENHIVINEIDDTSNQLMYFALMWDDFVSMTEAELRDYYGTEFVPEVPEDLADLRRESHLGIYRRDGGTGEVYHDEQRLTWVTEDYSRGVTVSVRKDQLPYQFFALLTQEEMETSEIRGVEVSIGQTEYGTWLVEFLYNEVGIRICADGLTQDELVAVVESLIAD